MIALEVIGGLISVPCSRGRAYMCPRRIAPHRLGKTSGEDRGLTAIRHTYRKEEHNGREHHGSNGWQVTEIHVKVGDQVEEDDQVVTFEAMKMETPWGGPRTAWSRKSASSQAIRSTPIRSWPSSTNRRDIRAVIDGEKSIRSNCYADSRNNVDPFPSPGANAALWLDVTLVAAFGLFTAFAAQAAIYLPFSPVRSRPDAGRPARRRDPGQPPWRA